MAVSHVISTLYSFQNMRSMNDYFKKRRNYCTATLVYVHTIQISTIIVIVMVHRNKLYCRLLYDGIYHRSENIIHV